ncbi:universal stress protein [Algoriphagus hitonicola]|uniref:universal stress protein n=1 Tax=Algoriphagus hitonicola TaxID=435880 RepID=UPI0036206380
MKTIVVPFDFSPYSLAALKTAQKISSKSGAKIICVTVIPSEIDYDKLSDSARQKYSELREEKEEAERILPDYIHEVAPAKADIIQEIRIGVPYELILRVADENQADLIVMGAYGKGYTPVNLSARLFRKSFENQPCPYWLSKKPWMETISENWLLLPLFTPELKLHSIKSNLWSRHLNRVPI